MGAPGRSDKLFKNARKAALNYETDEKRKARSCFQRLGTSDKHKQKGFEVPGGPGWAWVAQLVERVLGKDEVTGSIPVNGSINLGVPNI
jgi:hypothetical protein